MIVVEGDSSLAHAALDGMTAPIVAEPYYAWVELQYRLKDNKQAAGVDSTQVDMEYWRGYLKQAVAENSIVRLSIRLHPDPSKSICRVKFAKKAALNFYTSMVFEGEGLADIQAYADEKVAAHPGKYNDKPPEFIDD